MARDVPALRAEDGFEIAVLRLRESGLPALPVTDGDGILRGLVTMDNITDVLLVRRARRPS
jgi:CBS domain-containing protein